jgi:hypothetical protein
MPLIGAWRAGIFINTGAAIASIISMTGAKIAKTGHFIQDARA